MSRRMGKSSMRKTTLREIRQSFGRYMAILAIVALGVGFFSGLQAATPDMLESADAYLQEQELFDFRLVSTLGFDKDAAEYFEGEEGVRAAEGAYTSDVLVTVEDGEESVLTAHTLLEVQNQPVLTEGRMPENGQECVVDATAFSDADIGKTLKISVNNEEDTSDSFAHKEYTIVGLVNSPYYINYERGTTSLGTGKVAGFFYLLPEGFDTDYYTEIFVRLSDNALIYSDEYEQLADKAEAVLEPLTEEAANARYDRLLDEAQSEIADAEAELSEETAKAEEELADAKKELDDARTELEEGQRQIEDGEAQIAEARQEISERESQLADLRTQLEEARAQLEQGRASLSAMAGQAEGDAALAETLAAQEAALMQREAELDAAWQQLLDGEAQIAAGREELDARSRQLEESRQEIFDGQKELADGEKEYEDGRKELAEETADARKKIDDVKKDLEDLKVPDTYVLGRDTNIGYACFENDSAIVREVASVFPLFFFLVAALVCVTTMNRMVEEQRTQIGVLKALGYEESTIMGKYLFYSGSAAGVGGILGFIAGSIIFPSVIWEAYKIMYTMGDMTIHFDLVTAVISMAAALLCSMGTTYLTCRYELHSTAAELIRPKSPAAGKRIIFERIPFLWNRFSFLVKVSIRNVFRYKKRFFMMIVGIGGCTALLLTGFGIKDSIADVASLQFEEIQTYDLSVTLKEDISQTEEEEIDKILSEDAQGYVKAAESTMDVVNEGSRKSVTVVIPESEEAIADYVKLYQEDEIPLAWPGTGSGVLTQKVAQQLGLGNGDTITAENEDGYHLELTLSGSSKNFLYNYLYLNKESWTAQNGEEPEFNCIYVKAGESVDMHEFSARLMNCDGVTNVTVNQDTMERFENMMTSLNYIVALIIICAGALAFIVLYNLTNINITERIREIATIKVLGFYPFETASYVFRENFVLTGIGAVLGLGLGILLHWFVMTKINVDMVAFDMRILPASYLYSILFTFAFAVIVNLVMYVKLERINMAESLKSIE